MKTNTYLQNFIITLIFLIPTLLNAQVLNAGIDSEIDLTDNNLLACTVTTNDQANNWSTPKQYKENILNNKNLALKNMPAFVGDRYTDSLALVALYNSAGGADWNSKTNWLTGNIDTWSGITVTNNRVTKIIQYGNNLIGVIPTEIGNLTDLTYLNLSFNELAGNIPTEIGNLTNLTELDFHFNKLTGSIPTEIGNLINLTYLNIYTNKLTGSIPTEIGNLTNLTYLALSSNELTGSIPTEIGNLTNLTYLSLSSNELTGSIPTEISNLTNLTSLYLNSNGLTGSIPTEIGNLTNLTTLNLSDNELIGSIPAEIGNLTNLTRLILNGNFLTGNIPVEIGNLINLSSFYLQNNQFTFLPNLENSEDMQYFDCTYNYLSFESLEMNYNIASGSSSFNKYSPQKEFSERQDISQEYGTTFTADATIGGAANTYQWYFNDEVLPSQNLAIIKIENIKGVNGGKYSCKVKNTIVTDLEINIAPIYLTIIYIIDAGADQEICSNSTFLAPILPQGLSGIWTSESENQIVNSTKENTAVQNLKPGANLFTWSVYSSDDLAFIGSDNVIITNNKQIPDAGKDQYVCENFTQLNANNPLEGVGKWSTISNSCIITNTSDPVASVSNLGLGTTTFYWTVSNGDCDNSDTVKIINNSISVNAGIDQLICTNETSLNGSEGIGEWTKIDGAGDIENTTANQTTVSNFIYGENVFQWSVSNDFCDASDEVTITSKKITANAGVNQPICENFTVMNANSPVGVTGVWSVEGGFAVMAEPSNPLTTVTDIGIGRNTLRWTIANEDCDAYNDVIVTNNSFVVDAGENQTICTDYYSLGATLEENQMGVWSQVAGGVTIANTLTPNTEITNIDFGNNILRWTVTEGECTESEDITISSYKATANAGADQNVCENSAQLEAQYTREGDVGFWSISSGIAIVTESNNLNSPVSNLQAGANPFIWTVDNYYGCTDNDEVVITNNLFTITAGVNQSVCGGFTDLNGSEPFPGTGVWSLPYGGTVTIVDENYYNTEIYDLSRGVNTIRWTVTKNGCLVADDVIITNNSPTIASANADQNICKDSTQLNANVPTIGLGRWSMESGSGILENSLVSNTKVTKLNTGINTLRWTITNGECESYDNVAITNNSFTITAGANQSVCSSSTNLNGTDPLLGVGLWSLPYGKAVIIVAPSSYNTEVTNLLQGVNTLRWTVTKNKCSVSDDVIITNDLPTIPDANIDQDIYRNYTLLKANTPAIGEGKWSVESGLGNFEDISNPNSQVTGLNLGINTLKWTITNNSCSLSDDLTVTNNSYTANAGSNQTICSNVANLSASEPSNATGIWSIPYGGGAVIDNVSSYNTVVRNLPQGVSIIRWSVTKNDWVEYDEVIITNNSPSVAKIEEVDNITCNNEFSLNANIPEVGTGSWSIELGDGVILDIYNPSAYVIDLNSGENTLKWTIINNDCPSTDEFVINNRTPDVYAGINQSICQNSANLSANLSNGESGVWSAGGNSVFDDNTNKNTSVNNLSAGSNTLRWTVSNEACSAYSEVIITNNLPSEANIANVENITCNSAFSLSANTPLIGQGAWSIVSGNGTILSKSNSPNLEIVNLNEGSNTLKWTITGNDDCLTNDEFVINSIVLNSSAGSNQTICKNYTNLSATLPEGTTGAWAIVSSEGTILSNNLFNTTVTDLNLGINIFRWTISKEICSEFDEVSIINNKLTASVDGNQSICSDELQIKANSLTVGEVGLWSVKGGYGVFDEITNSEVFVSSIDRGVNKFRWTISNSVCDDYAEIIVTNNSFDVEVGSDKAICEDYTSLSASSIVGGSGNWEIVSGQAVITAPNNPNTSVTDLNEGYNEFVWTEENPITNCLASDNIIIYNYTVTDNAGDNMESCDGTAMLEADAPGVGTGLWEIVAGAGEFDSPTTYNTTVRALTSGINTLSWQVTRNNCSNISEIQITNNKFSAYAGTDQIIYDNLTTLNASLPTGATGKWSLVSGDNNLVFANSSLKNTAVSNIGLGSNNFKWTVKYESCTSEDLVNISYELYCKAGNDLSVCTDFSQLSAEAIVVPGGEGTWSIGNAAITFDNPNGADTYIRGLSDGENIARWTCRFGTYEEFDETIITYTPPAQADFNPNFSEGCSPLEVSFLNITENNSSEELIYKWSFGEDNETVTERNSTYNYELGYGEDITNFDVELIVTSESGCTSSKTKQITVYPELFVEFITPGLERIEWPENEFTFTNLSQTGYHDYSWNFDDGSIVSDAAPSVSHTFPYWGVYNVTLSATTEFGCTAMDNLTVEISPSFVGIEEVNEDIKIFSFQKTIHINSSSIKINNIELYSLEGKKLITKEINSVGNYSFEANFEAGIYILKLQHGEEHFSTKVMIE